MAIGIYWIRCNGRESDPYLIDSCGYCDNYEVGIKSIKRSTRLIENRQFDLYKKCSQIIKIDKMDEDLHFILLLR